jgi:hypothetical protein
VKALVGSNPTLSAIEATGQRPSTDSVDDFRGSGSLSTSQSVLISARPVLND